MRRTHRPDDGEPRAGESGWKCLINMSNNPPQDTMLSGLLRNLELAGR